MDEKIINQGNSSTDEVEVMSKQQGELHQKLWAIADDLRGSMEAGDFKDYILGLIFYKYLSSNIVSVCSKLLLEDDITLEVAWEDKEYKEGLVEELQYTLGYHIEPKFLFTTMINEIKEGNFDIEMLQKALNAVSASTMGLDSNEDFDGLFADMDLNNNKLGKDIKSRSLLISKVMERIDELSFLFEDSKIDVLGDAYEYLIGQFATNAGKKAGEFYTPRQVSDILAKIVTLERPEIKRLYDPTCGSGSLLLSVHKEAKVRETYGQEKISTTYNLCRMNMLLHGLQYRDFNIKNSDTLTDPQHLDKQFDAIVANPPYSLKWSADSSFKSDERFSAYGKLAPKSAADFAFIQHMIYQLEGIGTMAVVLPHGVLFRGNAEKVIREHLIDKDYLDAVIGLPANIFYGTSIPTCILVFKKCRDSKEILFIDASNEFKKQKNQNRLTEDNINKIIETFKERREVEKYSYNATMEEIKENDYNLNIPRYVDTFEEEEDIDINAVQEEIFKIDKEIENTKAELNVFLRELGLKEF
ncbi:MAG: type I restriction-modification system subunit M [Lachnospirales bacterium]